MDVYIALSHAHIHSGIRGARGGAGEYPSMSYLMRVDKRRPIGVPGRTKVFQSWLPVVYLSRGSLEDLRSIHSEAIQLLLLLHTRWWSLVLHPVWTFALVSTSTIENLSMCREAAELLWISYSIRPGTVMQ